MWKLFGLSVMALAFGPVAQGQWELQASGVTASLRGIDSVGGGVAWASGSGGTVLRTLDGGKHWEKCAVPVGGETLDFRGVQAFDAKTAIVMSSGPGEASRLYKTVDGCGTWKLVAMNPDKDGFWDALFLKDHKFGALLGDPVGGQFVLYTTKDGGDHWVRRSYAGLTADAKKEGAFAASNSSLLDWANPVKRFFVTGGIGGAFFFNCRGELEPDIDPWQMECERDVKPLPLAGGTSGAGAFSLTAHGRKFVVVGGDYEHPDVRSGTAAYSENIGSQEWHPAETLPGGYRSAVGFDVTRSVWITVGPNGTDFSKNDGQNWNALKPAVEDMVDADKHWNALSLPFVVGEKGRIGLLRCGVVPRSSGAIPALCAY